MTSIGSLAFDEFGRPFLILRDQGSQMRLSGKDAIKVSLHFIGRKPAHLVAHTTLRMFQKDSPFLMPKMFRNAWYRSIIVKLITAI